MFKDYFKKLFRKFKKVFSKTEKKVAADIVKIEKTTQKEIKEDVQW